MVSALKRWVSFVGTNQWYQHSRGGFLGLGQISDVGIQEVGFLGWDKPVRSTLKRSVFWVSFCGPLANVISDGFDNICTLCCCQQ